MTKDPVTLDADASAQETLALMLAKGFRHVPGDGDRAARRHRVDA